MEALLLEVWNSSRSEHITFPGNLVLNHFCHCYVNYDPESYCFFPYCNFIWYWNFFVLFNVEMNAWFRWCHTLKFLNFRMWLKLKIKQHFSHNSKNFPTFIFFTGKIIIKENRLVDFSKLNEVVCWLCIHAVCA